MSETATVEVLTAEVRALMVGSRQITLSVFRQLDWVKWEECEPMGRVNDDKDKEDDLDIGFVVGKHKKSGVLCRARLRTPPPWKEWDERALQDKKRWGYEHTTAYKNLEKKRDLYNEWWDKNALLYFNFQALPLIILAGLK